MQDLVILTSFDEEEEHERKRHHRFSREPIPLGDMVDYLGFGNGGSELIFYRSWSKSGIGKPIPIKGMDEWKDPDKALEAVRRNPNMIRYVRQTEEVCQEAVKQSPFLLVWINHPSFETCLKAVKREVRVLKVMKDVEKWKRELNHRFGVSKDEELKNVIIEIEPYN